MYKTNDRDSGARTQMIAINNKKLVAPPPPFLAMTGNR